MDLITLWTGGVSWGEERGEWRILLDENENENNDVKGVEKKIMGRKWRVGGDGGGNGGDELKEWK